VSTVKIADLDLTDAIEAAAQKLGGEQYAEADKFTQSVVKQRILEAVLPVLPYVIKQVGEKAEDAGFNRGWDEGFLGVEKPNPYEELDPTDPHSF